MSDNLKIRQPLDAKRINMNQALEGLIGQEQSVTAFDASLQA